MTGDGGYQFYAFGPTGLRLVVVNYLLLKDVHSFSFISLPVGYGCVLGQSWPLPAFGHTGMDGKANVAETALMHC